VSTSVLGYQPPPWLSEGIEGPCADADPEVFFPPTYGLACASEIREARKVCGRCEVLERCLAWAVPQTDLEGIFGGTTPRERRRIRAKAKKQQESETDDDTEAPA
jgi:WhiB family redox-sensing transcriptional regulator